ncbi:metal-dependent hydrolase [Myxococcota bacterium]|nr:metal-dependent hydrolase [Myxococcota bacterium]
MDNVTHTLFGALLGATLVPPGSRLHRGAVVAAMVGSNLPDADLVVYLLPPPAGGDSLAYLLHHRGWTHVLLAAPVLAPVAVWAGIRAGGLGRGAWPALAGVALAAGLLHVGADALNDYGVHPFSPFDHRWIYGDTLFIAEPAIWLALLPFAAAAAPSRAARVLCLALAAIPLGLAWGGVLGTLPTALGLTAWAVLALFAQSRLGGVLPAWAGLLAVVLAFAAGARAARTLVSEALARAAPGERIAQVVVSPAPGNPACARVIAASVDGADWRLRLGTVDLLRRRGDAPACHPFAHRPRTLALEPPSTPVPEGVVWLGEYSVPLAEIRAASAEDCRLAALLRFARVPFLADPPEGRIAGDLRYDIEPGLGFAEIPLDGAGPCPSPVPPWETPALGLLAPAGR